MYFRIKAISSNSVFFTFLFLIWNLGYFMGFIKRHKFKQPKEGTKNKRSTGIGTCETKKKTFVLRHMVKHPACKLSHYLNKKKTTSNPYTTYLTEHLWATAQYSTAKPKFGLLFTYFCILLSSPPPLSSLFDGLRWRRSWLNTQVSTCKCGYKVCLNYIVFHASYLVNLI